MPPPALRVRQPWLSGPEDLATACEAQDEGLVLSGSRRLALGAILVVALLMPLAPLVLAAWSVLDSSGLEGTVARFEQVSHIAGLVQLGSFPLFLGLAILLARSQKE